MASTFLPMKLRMKACFFSAASSRRMRLRSRLRGPDLIELAAGVPGAGISENVEVGEGQVCDQAAGDSNSASVSLGSVMTSAPMAAEGMAARIFSIFSR